MASTEDVRGSGPDLSRKQVATMLGVSVASVRRLEGVRLHPTLDEKRRWRFAAREVADLAMQQPRRQKPAARRRPKREGDHAARIFRMFDRGLTLRQIVTRACHPPKQVRELYREWLLGLREGEQRRRQDEARDLERRERLEAERAHVELMKVLGQ